MAENILRKLVNNSQMAIDDGVYEIDANLQKSNQRFQTNYHNEFASNIAN